MPATIDKKCKCCGNPITVRLADHKRGRGKFCSKSCKAIKQEARTGQHAAHHNRFLRAEYANRYGGNPQFSDKGEH